LLALQSKLNEEKSLRQKFESLCQEKERQISMINVDYRQLMQQIQKIEGELRQETEKTKALKVQLEEDVHKRTHLQSDLKEQTEGMINLRQREQHLLKEVNDFKELKRKAEEELIKLKGFEFKIFLIRLLVIKFIYRYILH
jgi:chromosome segregation ATPase